MDQEYRPPKPALPQALREKKEAREKLESGTPPANTEPVAPASAPVAAPAVTEPQAAEPVIQPAPAAEPVVALAPEGAIVPVQTPPDKKPGPKPGETADDAVKRMSAALTALQGKYNAEVPHLMRENARLVKEHEDITAANEQFKGTVADLEKRLAAAPTKPAEPTESEKTVADSLGLTTEDFMALKNAILAGVPQPKAEPAPVVNKPAPASAQAPEHSLAPERGTFFTTLDTLIGGEEVRNAIVHDPQFVVFLDLRDANTLDPHTKIPVSIRSIASEADANNNAVKMAEVYRAFSSWKAQSTVRTTQPQPKHLMPTPQGGGGDLQTNKKPIYTQAQYDEFKRRMTRGDFRTIGKSPEEAAKLTQELTFLSEEFRAARLEGRIVGSEE